MQYGDYGPKEDAESRVPDIVADPANPTAWVEPDAKQPLTFKAVGQSQSISMVPLNQVFDDRYAVYWKANNKNT